MSSASFNRVILIGNVTRDVEVKFTEGGLPVAKLSMAINGRVKRAGEWVDDVTFVDVSAFGRTAEVAGEYLKKGSPVFIEGRLKFDQWEKDGVTHRRLSVICERMQLIGSKPSTPSSSGVTPAQSSGGYSPF